VWSARSRAVTDETHALSRFDGSRTDAAREDTASRNAYFYALLSTQGANDWFLGAAQEILLHLQPYRIYIFAARLCSFCSEPSVMS
jgi:hypothetical protein